MHVVFMDRDDAGRKLGESYNGPGRDPVVLGIPRGGIPIGYHLASAIGGDLDAIVVRKLPLPANPEAGFGAIAPDGSRVLNEDMLRGMRLSKAEIDHISYRVLQEVKRRETKYRGDRPLPALQGKDVVLTDDGLATGYTMIAAIKMVRTYGPASVSTAVPVSPSGTARYIEPLVDYFHCLRVSDDYPFAVASFYHDFHDMSDEEVVSYLDKAGQEGQNDIEYSRQGERHEG